ncbi:MAG TPA: hypothetical protein VEK57_26545 [Thermoanaerobaculia bacterium]|nr:hypothetical protein [Thermoanaerobaculia bacterium]
MDRIIKLVVVAAIVFGLWKYGLPWVKKLGGNDTPKTTISRGGGGGCARSAERASETWGGGIRQFANPPADLNAWSNFRGNVESGINAAEADCGCQAESCRKALSAMRDLRALVNDFDSTIRNGTSASDFVQRQESIDNQINEAADLERAGK